MYNYIDMKNYKGILFLFFTLYINCLWAARPQSLYERGMMNLKSKNYSAAADYLGQAADYDPNNVWARFYYVWAIARLGKKQEAKRWLPKLKSVSNTPEYKKLNEIINKNDIVLRKDDKESVISKANVPEWAKPRQRTKKKQKAKSVIEQAQELIELNKINEATSLLNEYLKNNKKSLDAYRLLGTIAFNEYNYDKCISDFEKAFSYGAKDFDSYFMVAQACMNLQKENEALKYYKKASEINKEDTFVKLAIADIYCKQADYANAEKSYNEILKKDYKVTDASVGLANILYEQGYLEEALKQADNILLTMPDNAKALFLKAKIYMEEKKYKEASENAQAAYENNQSNMEYEAFAALGLIRDFKIKPAIEMLNEILGKHEDNVYAINALAEAYMVSEKINEAKNLLDKAESIEKIPQTSFLYGLFYVTQGNNSKAKINFLEYKKRAGNLPRVLLEYANFLENSNDYKEAQKEYKTIIEKHKNTPFAKIAKERLDELNGHIHLSRPVYIKPAPEF